MPGGDIIAKQFRGDIIAELPHPHPILLTAIIGLQYFGAVF